MDRCGGRHLYVDPSVWHRGISDYPWKFIFYSILDDVESFETSDPKRPQIPFVSHVQGDQLLCYGGDDLAQSGSFVSLIEGRFKKIFS